MQYNDLFYRMAQLRQEDLLREAEHAGLLKQLNESPASNRSVRRRSGAVLMRLGCWVGGAALGELTQRQRIDPTATVA